MCVYYVKTLKKLLSFFTFSITPLCLSSFYFCNFLFCTPLNLFFDIVNAKVKI